MAQKARMPQHVRHDKLGFSLVELSIVLVILGLLTGGILTGQSLIRASELRAVTTERDRYVSATRAFLDKYFALPGDMANATIFWGAAHATPATCATTVSTSAATCNGNGDGVVAFALPTHEAYRYWQHLANAGLIEGAYSGVGGTNAFTSLEANSPRSKISSGFWFVWNWGVMTGGGGIVAGNYGHFLQVGALQANNSPNNGVFLPEELWNIDMKVDDGRPMTGSVVTGDYTANTNATGPSDVNATYSVGAPWRSIIRFRQQF